MRQDGQVDEEAVGFLTELYQYMEFRGCQIPEPRTADEVEAQRRYRKHDDDHV